MSFSILICMYDCLRDTVTARCLYQLMWHSTVENLVKEKRHFKWQALMGRKDKRRTCVAHDKFIDLYIVIRS